MTFKRTIEDFICSNCGAKVRGSGYTNHCPKCLWSKHVDMHPGDRAAVCGGMMEPVAVEGSTPTYRIVQRCKTCGMYRRVTAHSTDDTQSLVVLAAARKT